MLNLKKKVLWCQDIFDFMSIKEVYLRFIWSAFLRFLNKWTNCNMSLTQISSDTLLWLKSMCILCVLAAVWPHTFAIRYWYLLWYMICWTELSGSTFTKATDLLFWHISLVNDKVLCVMNGVVETSYPILSQYTLLNWRLFRLVWLER